MKRFLATVVCLCLCLGSILPCAAENGTPPTITSAAAYMVDYDTGEVVYEKNADERRYPASLTKIAAVLCCLRQIPDWRTRTVTVPQEVMDAVTDPDAAVVGLEVGEVLPLRDAISATLLASACEAATLLAYAVDGLNTAAFLDRMNAVAAEAGATGTHFANPHGLPDENNYSTARDMAAITRLAMANPDFYELAGMVIYDMSATNAHPQARTIKTTNDLLWPDSPYYLPEAYGVKTGYLESAGYCLAATAQRGDFRYLLVTLGAPEPENNFVLHSYEDHRALYEWAFSSLRRLTLLDTQTTVATLPVAEAKDVGQVELVPADSYTALATSTDDFQTVTELPDTLCAPLDAGETAGTLHLIDRRNGQTVLTTALLVKTTVARDVPWWECIGNWFSALWRTVTGWFS